MAEGNVVLIVGELIVDYTVGQHGAMCKLRLGGVAHAARGLWASGVDYAIAAFCPRYLVDEAKDYLSALGCRAFIWLGDVLGAPNVILIGDVQETGHQGYEDLMRESKKILFHERLPSLREYTNVLVFPGRFDMAMLSNILSDHARISFDIAYDLEDLAPLEVFIGRIDSIIISTSSSLFMEFGKDGVDGLLDRIKLLTPRLFLLKENRGGSRLFNLHDGSTCNIPAMLGITVNSVGVGDVYSSVMVGLSTCGWKEAAWRGSQIATLYSQSTFPDDIKRDMQRWLEVPFDVIQTLEGVSLPWHARQRYSIYLAGPDFSYLDKRELERAVDCLNYHNFRIRRPVMEHGELRRPAEEGDLRRTYHRDYRLLEECDLVFAVPLERDPGTLVEIGLAIAMGKPVITYDPRRENENTMVMIGSTAYSSDLDICLNGTFNAMAKLEALSQ